MRHERFSLLPGSACTSPHPHGARAAFVLVQRWYVARNHESGSSVSAPPGASVARPARIAEPTPVSASALRRKLSAPQLGGYAPSWTLGRYSRTPVQPVLSSETTMKTCKKQNISSAYFLVRASHARLFGACGCVSGRARRPSNETKRAYFLCPKLCSCATTYALPCLSDYGLWAAALERARHPCVPTVSVVVREADERTDSMLGEERNLPAVASYWRTARSSDSTSDRSDSSLSLSAA